MMNKLFFLFTSDILFPTEIFFSLSCLFLSLSYMHWINYFCIIDIHSKFLKNIFFFVLADAFMRLPPFYHAFLICIRTVEHSDPALLVDIDPKLVKNNELFFYPIKKEFYFSSLLLDFVRQYQQMMLTQVCHHQS